MHGRLRFHLSRLFYLWNCREHSQQEKSTLVLSIEVFSVSRLNVLRSWRLLCNCFQSIPGSLFVQPGDEQLWSTRCKFASLQAEYKSHRPPPPIILERFYDLWDAAVSLRLHNVQREVDASLGWGGGGGEGRKCLLLSFFLFPSSDLIRLLQLAGGPARLRYRQTTNEPAPRFLLSPNSPTRPQSLWHPASETGNREPLIWLAARSQLHYSLVSAANLSLCRNRSCFCGLRVSECSGSRDEELLGGFHIITHLINYLTVCPHIRGKHDFSVGIRKSVLAQRQGWSQRILILIRAVNQ